MIHVIGIDPATKHLGVARTDGTLEELNAKTGASDPVRRLYELERLLETTIRHHPPLPALFIVEGYALGTPGRLALVRLGEVGAMVRLLSFRLGAELVEVPPSSLKRFATGRGNADKAQMVVAADAKGARFSRPLTGGKDEPHDEADAFHLRRLGRMAYGQEQATEDHEREVLASIVWPVLR